MAQVLRFIDSFDHYAQAQLLSKWTFRTVSLDFVTNIGAWGRNGTSAYKSQNGSGAGLGLTVPGGAATDLVAGFAFQHDGNLSGDGGNQNIFAFNKGSLNQISVDFVGGLNTIKVLKDKYPAVTAGTVIANGTRVLSANTWYSIEVYVKIAAAVGRVIVRVNELIDIDFTGDTNPRGADCDTISLKMSQGSAGGVMFFDDFFLATGGSSFYGDCRAEALFPNSDGSRTDFTPSAGASHYQMVDEVTPNEDVDYNKSLTVGHKDSYQFSDPSPTSATVKGIQYVPRARTDDEGTRTIKSFYRSLSGNEYESPNSLGLSSAYAIPIGDIVELNPETGNAWTIQELKDAQFGLKVQA